MQKRFVSIWFPHLSTDWFSLRQHSIVKSSGTAPPNSFISFHKVPFVLRASSHGKMIIIAANILAEQKGIHTSMALADARAIIPDLQVMDNKSDLVEKLLPRLAEWCIRFSPIVAIDLPDGLLMDVTGCAHLWGNESSYLKEISNRLNERGYEVRIAMADTIGLAWGIARYGRSNRIIESSNHIEALIQLPPEALRLEAEATGRLHKLGLHQISQFIRLPRHALRRRFGPAFIRQLDKALGQELELLEPVHPIEPYHERLPCLEPITTLTGIAIALQQLLETLCLRLKQEQKGARTVIFKGFRVDGKVEQISIGTNRSTHHVKNLFKLLELKLSTIEPALGIELFVLEVHKVEDHLPEQDILWEEASGNQEIRLSELIDRLAAKVGTQTIHRYVPDEHYWPERSFRKAASLIEKSPAPWREDKLRPLHLLTPPQRIEVSAPIPDYPPMLFRHQGKVHTIVKADGPERIEQEWWLQQGQHRDYYRVEDQEGHRYWLFRLGHYDDKIFHWFIHGFFA